jgi:divalent metal cation (Fe/Co/Zn/Cd) transporter
VWEVAKSGDNFDAGAQTSVTFTLCFRRSHVGQGSSKNRHSQVGSIRLRTETTGHQLAEGSRRVVLAALAGNGAIALAKFVASAISASTAMLTEAIHSLVDTGDQVLLLERGEKPADATHPLGYGMEAYFWSFVVAVMVFLVGGVLSIYEGAIQILSPEPVNGSWISLGVLAVAAAFEGTSFRVAYREYRRVVRQPI